MSLEKLATGISSCTNVAFSGEVRRRTISCVVLLICIYCYNKRNSISVKVKTAKLWRAKSFKSALLCSALLIKMFATEKLIS